MTDADHFLRVLERRVSRRRFLSGSAVLCSSFGCGSLFANSVDRSDPHALWEFPEISHGSEDVHRVAEGFEAKVLLSWGDSLVRDGRFDPATFSAEDQRQAFGYNNDFTAFMPFDESAAIPARSPDSASSARGLLCVNHEYVSSRMMFGGDRLGDGGFDAERIAIEMAASGHSIIEIRLVAGQWRVVTGSRYNRRVTADTPMVLVGPAARSDRLRTRRSPDGVACEGTAANCGGGKTPWGTVLTAEEGFASLFHGDPDRLPRRYRKESYNHRRLGIHPNPFARDWYKIQRRFDIEVEPNEPNHFGWIVELNPYDPASTPRKLTSLGRFAHEAATVVSRPGARIAVYMGDDGANQFVYKFVSRAVFDPANPARNRELLVDGTLYCARFLEDGSGRWLPLVHGHGELVAANGFANQADVLIDCRRAARLVGATPMDRPEDVESNPFNGRTYVVLTKSDSMEGENGANPRKPNGAGHILELSHPTVGGEQDHAATVFSWDIFLMGGDPDAPSAADRGAYGRGVTAHGWLANPDNIAFGSGGTMWVATDGCGDFGFNDGVWMVPTGGANRAVPRHFFSCPRGAEACGPEFTPDFETLFVSVQHPAQDSESGYDSPMHRWPDFDPRLPPRPSVVAIRRARV